MAASFNKLRAKIGKLVRKYTAEVFKALIPVHFKRIIYLITLYHFMRADHPELQAKASEDLIQLNNYLELAKTDASSLILPGLFTERLWRGDGVSLVTLPDELLIKRMLRTIPCWLKYADEATIAKDVVELRSYVADQGRHLQLQHK